MNLAAIITFFICAILVAIISWYKTRREKHDTASGFLFANRKLGFIAVGGALYFTNVNAAEFIGENESVYLNNMTVMAWGISSVFAMLVVSEFIMPIYMRGAMSTTPDFLESRYDAGTKKLVSILFLISYLVNMLPIVLYSGAVAINGLFHFSDFLGIGYATSIWILILVIGVAGCTYSVLGGLKAISVSDVALGAGMVAGGLLLLYFGFDYLGKGNAADGIRTVLSSNTNRFNAVGNAKDAVPFSTIFTGMLIINLFYWGTEQVIVQQALSAKNLAESQKGIALACVGKLIGPLLFNIPGIIAVHLYSHMQNTAEVFPRLVSDVTPPVLSGFIASVIFGAAITSFAPGLNSAGTLFILNLYKPYKAKKKEPVTERQLVKRTKQFELFACLLAVCIAPLILLSKGGFYTYMQKVNGVFNVPIFTIMFVGFITRKVPPVAAKTGLIFCIAAYLLTQLVFDTGLHFLHVLAILFLLTVLLMLVIGKCYPLKTPYVPVDKGVIDLKPWKGRYWAAAVLLLIMMAIFIVFSPVGIAAGNP